MAELILTSNTTFEAVDLINGAFSATTNLWSGSTGTGSIIRSNDTGNLASGNYSYAEGSGTTAFGAHSYSEGSHTLAQAEYSYAEGSGTTASGFASHAGGQNSKAEGEYSFCHGLNNIVQGKGSVILGGSGNEITGTSVSQNIYNSVLAGQRNRIWADNIGNLIGGGRKNEITDDPGGSLYSSIIAGDNNYINGAGSNGATIIGGEDNTITKSPASAIIAGNHDTALPITNCSILSSTTSSILASAGSVISYSNYSQIIGGSGNTINSGSTDTITINSVILGGSSNQIQGSPSTVADETKNCSIVGGNNNYIFASENCSILGGNDNQISGSFLATQIANTNSVIVGGQYNLMYAGGGTTNEGCIILGGYRNTIRDKVNSIAMGTGVRVSSANTISMGYGGAAPTNSSGLSNRISFNMEFGDGVFEDAVNVGFADYAEYFEWNDGNTLSEDRVGYFVSLVGKKIEIGNYNIVGVVSANPGVIGDAASLKWNEIFLKDEFDRKLYDTYKVYKINSGQTTIYIDENNNTYLNRPSAYNMTGDLYEESTSGKTFVKNEVVPRFNPSFDKNQEYESREERQEWSTIGLLGKLDVRTSEEITGTKVSVDVNGMAINGTDYHVLEKTKDYDGNYGIVQILFK